MLDSSDVVVNKESSRTVICGQGYAWAKVEGAHVPCTGESLCARVDVAMADAAVSDEDRDTYFVRLQSTLSVGQRLRLRSFCFDDASRRGLKAFRPCVIFTSTRLVTTYSCFWLSKKK
jgi:hypothetical protein